MKLETRLKGNETGSSSIGGVSRELCGGIELISVFSVMNWNCSTGLHGSSPFLRTSNDRGSWVELTGRDGAEGPDANDTPSTQPKDLDIWGRMTLRSSPGSTIRGASKMQMERALTTRMLPGVNTT